MKSPFLKSLYCIVAIALYTGSVMAQPTAVVSTHATTCGQANGSAMVTASNGAGYTYQWSTGTSTTDTISNLSSGNYTVTVYSTLPAIPDSVVQAFTIAASQPAATFQSDALPTCGQNNGSIIYTTNGSNVSTTLLRNNVVVENGGQTSFSNLAPGTYTFIVNNPSLGCIDTFPSISLLDTTSNYPIFNNIAITPVKCFGNSNGAITVTVGNCNGCTYAWSQSATDHTDSAVGLTAGSYTFSVSEGACTNIDTVIKVTGPTSALYDSIGRNHADHCSQNLGSALILGGGGSPPYTYSYSMGTNMGDSVSHLTGDSILGVTIIDSHGCKDSVAVPIGNSPGPAATISATTICGTDQNGTVTVTPTTSDGPFTYTWTNGQTSATDTGLAVGTYTVTVTDAGGCTISLSDNVVGYSTVSSITADPSVDIVLGQSVELQIQTSVTYSNITWSPYIPGSNGNTSITVKPDTTSVYSAIIYYGQNCQLFDTVVINVNLDTVKWVIPNTFTPNGDGVNDYYALIRYPVLKTFHIWVYNRWGDKVFESTQPDFQWYGHDQFGGDKPLNTGVFAYVIEYVSFDSPDSKTIGGNISLVK